MKAFYRPVNVLGMYPFGHTLEISTDDDSSNGPTANGHPLRSKSGSPKSDDTRECGVEYKHRTTSTNLRPAINGRDVRTHFAPRLVGCISRSLRPVFIFLRILSLFPVLIQRGNNRRRKRWRRLTMTVILFNVALALIVLNLYLSNLNLEVTLMYEDGFGLMHALTVSSIVNGIKPVICCFLIALFTFRIKTHTRLIRLIDAIDLSFRSAFRASPPVRGYSLFIFVFSFISFAIPFGYRSFEVYYMNISFNGPLEYLAPLLVPMLTVWNIVPLLYYCLHNQIVRFYLTTLINALDKEHTRRVFSLKFYYEQFLRITVIQEGIGTFFNPYILFSLSWSVAVLCLTIYFITQDHTSLYVKVIPSNNTSPELANYINRAVNISIGWASIQVIVALLHIALICQTGMKTNETTRQVVNAVLRVVPDTSADLDRFQIACFVHKMTTQFMWGMTVWRAFPLERSTFFTLVSLIVTYSFLLLKLKDNPSLSPNPHPQLNHNAACLCNCSGELAYFDEI